MSNFLKKAFVTLVVGTTIVGAMSTVSQKKTNKNGNNDTDSPTQLSAGGWKRALKETKDALKNKELGTLAAALAYYGTFAFFPTLVAFISIFSLVISQEQLASTIVAAEAYLPTELANVVTAQLERLTQRPQTSIIAAGIAIAVALFGASGGVQNLLKATNHAYDVEETRGFVKLRLISLAFILGGFIVVIPLLGLLVMSSDILVAYGAPEWTSIAVNVARWLTIIVIISIALAVIYRYGPNRQDPKWQWVSWGAGAATIIWAIGSAIFFYYLQNLADFQASYGVFAGIIAMMLWLNVSAFIILLGAEVNHRLERQTSAVTVDD